MESDEKLVMDRLLSVYGVTTDSELAALLQISRSTVGSWRLRNVVPIAECLKVAREKQVSLDWLLLGRGTPTWTEAKTDAPHFPPANLPDALPAGDWTPADLRVLARVSGYEKLWSILRELELGLTSLEHLQAATEIPADWLSGYLLLLERQGMIVRQGNEWQLSTSGAVVLRSKDPADVAAHAVTAVDFLVNEVLPGAAGTSGTLILTEIRVREGTGSLFLKEHLKTCLMNLDADEGTVVRLLIGMAPERKGS